MTQDIRGTAIALTFGLFDRPTAKTAHGLLRGSERFQLIGIVDPKLAGPTAHFPTLPPVFPDIATALRTIRPGFAIIGVATSGGRLPSAFRNEVANLLEAGLDLVSGLHQPLSKDPEFSSIAARSGAVIHEIRQPKPWDELRLWNGDIYSIRAPIVAVLGTDCAMGKRTTTRLATAACQAKGVNAQMIYTGQTGWMQGVRHGFILDATLKDFVAGELEGAILDCARAENPDLILLEGQGALRYPAMPCGAEMMLSANAKAVVLQVAPTRRYYKVGDGFRCELPNIAAEIELIRQYGSQVICLTLNDERMTAEQALNLQQDLEQAFGIPVVQPLLSVSRLADCLIGYAQGIAPA